MDMASAYQGISIITNEDKPCYGTEEEGFVYGIMQN